VLPPPAEKADYVKGMFDRIAGGYDRVNDWMTGGLHRLWKRRMVAMLAPKAGEAALDLATGTGDLAILLKDRVAPGGTVTGLDFSAGMLAIAQRRPDGSGVTWIEGDMLALPFADASVDVVTVGFGLRNVADLDLAIAEIARVLRPGGRFGSLEMAHPRSAVMRAAVAAHSAVLPVFGRLVAGDGDAYKYLHASAKAFTDQDALGELCRKAGLVDVVVNDVAGGALAIVTGRK
jgi:demethylmenaquinone methyltransferase/2-methoxy-6-polyprenyl-1,4-benzoquinol methylase